MLTPAVSLDYPFYQQLVRRRHSAAGWWLVGDRLYYLGLIPALAASAGGDSRRRPSDDRLSVRL